MRQKENDDNFVAKHNFVKNKKKWMKTTINSEGPKKSWMGIQTSKKITKPF